MSAPYQRANQREHASSSPRAGWSGEHVISRPLDRVQRGASPRHERGHRQAHAHPVQLIDQRHAPGEQAPCTIDLERQYRAQRSPGVLG